MSVKADFDKVLTVFDGNKLVSVIVQDPVTHTPTHFKVEKMSMEEVMTLVNSNDEKPLPTN